MSDALFWHRLQFAFTITYHYLFPQLTMGLGLLLVILKTLAIRTGDEHYNQAARFWARIFGINFVVGVVTGIPMEFQFGTNWAGFSRYGGGVIGQTLAMEGMFAFFLESVFIGALIWGEKRLGPRLHFLAALAVSTQRPFGLNSTWRTGWLCRSGWPRCWWRLDEDFAPLPQSNSAMAVTSLTSSEFDQNVSAAKEAALNGAVFITDSGRPMHVLDDREPVRELLG